MKFFDNACKCCKMLKIDQKNFGEKNKFYSL